MRNRRKATGAGPSEQDGGEAGKVDRILTGQRISSLLLQRLRTISQLTLLGGKSLVLWVIARLCLTH